MAVTSHKSFTLNYTTYQGWSGKSYYGRRSGVKAVPTKTDNCSITSQTEKAVKISSALGYLWLPKSVISYSQDGSITVNRGFCYINNGLTWLQASFSNQKGTFSPRRTTVI